MERRDEPHSSDRSGGREMTPAEQVARDPEGKAPQLEGGVVGAGAGAAMGMVGGPVGMVVGALAGAVGGWWAIDRITEGMGAYPEDEDDWYRRQYETPEYHVADRSYEEVRPAYLYGHLCARHPAFGGRSFAEVEPELERDWNAALAGQHGEWGQARRYAQVAFEHGARR